MSQTVENRTWTMVRRMIDGKPILTRNATDLRFSKVAIDQNQPDELFLTKLSADFLDFTQV